MDTQNLGQIWLETSIEYCNLAALNAFNIYNAYRYKEKAFARAILALAEAHEEAAKVYQAHLDKYLEAQ